MNVGSGLSCKQTATMADISHKRREAKRDSLIKCQVMSKRESFFDG